MTIKKFDAFSDSDIETIKDIILELKHEFTEIDGEIYNKKYDRGNVTIIELSPMKVYNEKCVTIENLEKKMKYYNLIIEVATRIKDATKRDVRIVDLFNEKLGSVEIWIDDIKNKTK